MAEPNKITWTLNNRANGGHAHASFEIQYKEEGGGCTAVAPAFPDTTVTAADKFAAWALISDEVIRRLDADRDLSARLTPSACLCPVTV